MPTFKGSTILVTGGAGFIGSCFVRRAVRGGAQVITLDKLGYASSLKALEPVKAKANHRLVEGDIRDGRLLKRLMEFHQPDTVVHFAAETHVDRSIDAPAEFISTNIVGTQTLLDASLKHYSHLPHRKRQGFRFLHVSTDEVYGSLGATGAFNEQTAYDPRSPYSASKAASDHLVAAWHHTYGLPTLTTNCTNNYGPWQFPEKLIPLMIAMAVSGRRLPVYGTGTNVRDWLHVEDHCDAIEHVIARGRPGQTYCIGGRAERTNLEVVKAICFFLDERRPRRDGKPHDSFIHFVKDRPGHDQRYAMDITKIRKELGWRPTRTFEQGLEETVVWYLSNQHWWQKQSYGQERLGLRMAG